jgi:hypothetical protein
MLVHDGILEATLPEVFDQIIASSWYRFCSETNISANVFCMCLMSRHTFFYLSGVSLLVLNAAKVDALLDGLELVPGGPLGHLVLAVLRVAPVHCVIGDSVVATEEKNAKEGVDLLTADVVAGPELDHGLLIGEVPDGVQQLLAHNHLVQAPRWQSLCPWYRLAQERVKITDKKS